MKAALIAFLSILSLVAAQSAYAGAALQPNPTTYRRCKEVVTNTYYKAEIMDCPENKYCASNYWQYTMTLNGGQTGCYIAPDDFGAYYFALNTSTCTNPNQVLTATYTRRIYDTTKDRTNIGSLANCNVTLPADLNVAITAGTLLDFTPYCDAVVSITVPATVTAPQCASFTVYGNAHAAGIKYAIVAGLMIVLSYLSM